MWTSVQPCRSSRGACSAIGVAIYPVANSNWTENALTNANAPTIGSAPLAAATITGTASQTYSFDLTNYLQQQQAAGASYVTVAIRGTAFTKGMVGFNSREASNPPQLVLNTGTAAPASTFSAAADSYVQNGTYAGANYGSAAQLLIKQAVAPYDRITYLTFTLAGLSQASISNATLRLFGGVPKVSRLCS